MCKHATVTRSGVHCGLFNKPMDFGGCLICDSCTDVKAIIEALQDAECPDCTKAASEGYKPTRLTTVLRVLRLGSKVAWLTNKLGIPQCEKCAKREKLLNGEYYEL